MMERKNERIESLNPIGAEDLILHDLSSTGVSCLHTVEKQPNSVVTVKINDLVLEAKVVYCQKRKEDVRLGLNFINVSPENQKKLNDIVEKFSKGIPVSCSVIEDAKNKNKPK